MKIELTEKELKCVIEALKNEWEDTHHLKWHEENCEIADKIEKQMCDVPKKKCLTCMNRNEIYWMNPCVTCKDYSNYVEG